MATTKFVRASQVHREPTCLDCDKPGDECACGPGCFDEGDRAYVTQARADAARWAAKEKARARASRAPRLSAADKVRAERYAREEAAFQAALKREG